MHIIKRHGASRILSATALLLIAGSAHADWRYNTTTSTATLEGTSTRNIPVAQGQKIDPASTNSAVFGNIFAIEMGADSSMASGTPTAILTTSAAIILDADASTDPENKNETTAILDGTLVVNGRNEAEGTTGVLAPQGLTLKSLDGSVQVKAQALYTPATASSAATISYAGKATGIAAAGVVLEKDIAGSVSAEVANIVTDANGAWQKQGADTDAVAFQADSVSGKGVNAAASFTAVTDKGNATAFKVNGNFGNAADITITTEEDAKKIPVNPTIQGTYTAQAGKVDAEGNVIASGNATAMEVEGTIGGYITARAESAAVAKLISMPEDKGGFDAKLSATAFGGDATALKAGDIVFSSYGDYSDAETYVEIAGNGYGHVKGTFEAHSVGGNATGISTDYFGGSDIDVAVTAVSEAGQKLKFDDDGNPVLETDDEDKPIPGKYVYEKLPAGNAIGVDAGSISSKENVRMVVQAKGASATAVSAYHKFGSAKTLSGMYSARATGNEGDSPYEAVGIEAESIFGTDIDAQVSAQADPISVNVGTEDVPDIKIYGGNAYGIRANDISEDNYALNIAQTTQVSAVAKGGKDTPSVEAVALDTTQGIYLSAGDIDDTAHPLDATFKPDADGKINLKEPYVGGRFNGTYSAEAGTYDEKTRQVLASGNATAVRTGGIDASTRVVLLSTVKNPEVLAPTGEQGGQVDITVKALNAGQNNTAAGLMAGYIDTTATVHQAQADASLAPQFKYYDGGSVRIDAEAISYGADALGIAVAGNIATGALQLDIHAESKGVIEAGEAKGGNAIGLYAGDFTVGNRMLVPALDADGNPVLDADKNPVLVEAFEKAPVQATITAISEQGNAWGMVTSATDFALDADIYAEALKGDAVGIELTSAVSKLALAGKVLAVSDKMSTPTAIKAAGALDLSLQDGTLIAATNSPANQQYLGQVLYGDAIVTGGDATVSVDGTAMVKGNVLIDSGNGDLVLEEGVLNISGNTVSANILTVKEAADLVLSSDYANRPFLDIQGLGADSKKGMDLVKLGGSATALIGDTADLMSQATAATIFAEDGGVPPSGIQQGEQIQYKFIPGNAGNLAYEVTALSYFTDSGLNANTKALGASLDGIIKHGDAAAVSALRDFKAAFDVADFNALANSILPSVNSYMTQQHFNAAASIGLTQIARLSGMRAYLGTLDAELEGADIAKPNNVSLVSVNSLSDQGGDQYLSGYNGFSAGGLAAFEYLFSKEFVVGFSMGGLYSKLTGYNNSGEGNSTAFVLNAYGDYGFTDSNIDVFFGVGYMHAWNESEKTTQFGTAKGEWDSDMVSGFVGVGYTCLPQESLWSLKPMLFLNMAYLQNDAYGETEGGLGALSVDSNNYVSAKTYLGLQAGYMASEAFSLNAQLFYAHEFGDNHYDVNASFLNMPVSRFSTHGAEFGRDSVVFGLGGDYKFSESTRVFLNYNVSAMDALINQGINAGVVFQW